MTDIQKIFITNAPLFVSIHFLALKLYLYWYYWWFDILMHLWGGGLIILAMISLSNLGLLVISIKNILLILLIITFGWEIFEWKLGLWNDDYIVDTAQDIFFGYLGGIITYMVIRLRCFTN